MRQAWPVPRGGIVLLALVTVLALTACDALVAVDANANVPPRYVRVLVTVEQVWFNQSATAVPEDETWEKVKLDDPVTLNLVALANGQSVRIIDDAKVPAARYRQLRLLLADTHGRLRDSADDFDADHNNEVTWIDEDGDLRTAPLEVPGFDRGIGMPIDLKVMEAAVSIGGASADNNVVVRFDAARDLTEFRYDGDRGFLLNATLEASDVKDAGTIRGSLNLSRLSVPATWYGRHDIQVTAQKVDKSAGRRVIVATASVNNNGGFMLYPLPIDEDERVTEYDLVIHGPEIQTIILRDVPVSEAGPGNAEMLLAGQLTLEPAQSFEANLSAAEPLAVPGARVGFYQKVPGENEPFLVGFAAVDPLSGRFVEPMRLSRAGTVLFGTYGSNLNLRTVTPEEGAGRFSVAAFSPHFAHGEFAATTLRAPTSSSEVASFTVPAPGIPVSVTAGTVSATVAVETPEKYDRGVLIVAREGSLVTLASLDGMLQQALGTTFIDLAPLPAGGAAAPNDRAYYYLEAWTWHSSDPEDTFVRHAGEAAVDLRNTDTASGSLTIR